MDKQDAIKIIRDTFESPFDKGQYVYFIKNLFNKIDEDTFEYHGRYITDSYKPYIKKYERIGKYSDSEGNKIDILIVNLKKETLLERARTMQRNFIAQYLKDRGEKDAAIVAFHTDDLEDWRFSLVKMEYKLVQTESGRIKAKEELTPARRYSFLVGKNEPNHTAQQQLAPLLQDDINNPSLDHLESAFNIEKVTKEFFEKYRNLFLEVKERLDEIAKKDKAVQKDFQEKGVDTVDFSKKLLGQIVFLYFLQKKGWFGVERDKSWGTGSKRFLCELFEKKRANYKNFFNDILEPLFYEALATERHEDFYSRFNCKIPFLNGGLFDPINDYDWVHTDILLPNESFSNDKTKEGDTGNGILDIFDRYNFTVKEDEPLEKEVAIDPEMLGKVFENLLEVKDRKSKGTYYTPREIVHYMCQQSLINYLYAELNQGTVSHEKIGDSQLDAFGNKAKTGQLVLTTEHKSYQSVSKEEIETLIKYGEQVSENEAVVETKGKETERYYYKLPENIRKNAKIIDEKLANIKVCDPAIGSGAFPVGMMTEIVKTRNALTTYLSLRGVPQSGTTKQSRTIYNFKRECIEKSLYGVDIDPSAVEIAKLRLWLSLVVDEEDIKQIKPLPNLDYKIMQGNSLLEEYEGIKLFDENLISPREDNQKQIEEIKTRQSILQKEYFQLHTEGKLSNIKKQQIETDLNNLNNALKNLMKEPKTEDKPELFDYLSEAKKKSDELKQLHKEIFDVSQKSKKDEIKKKIEILEWNLIEATLKEQNKESSLKKLEQFKKSNTRPFFLWKLNFFEVFQEKGGFDVVIGNPPYIKEYTFRNAFDGLRELPYYQGKMDIWYLFACKGIDLLKKNSGVLTFIAQNNWVTSYGASIMRNKVIQDTQIIQVLDFGSYMIFESSDIQTMVMIFRADSRSDNYKFDYRRLEGNDLNFNDVLDLLNYNKNSKTIYLKPTIQRNKFVDKPLTFSNTIIDAILDKLSEQSNFKLTKSEVANGIHHHHDRVSKDMQKKLGDKFNIGNGIFVLSNKEKNSIPFSKKELELIKPSYTTKELGRYYANRKNSEWVIYTGSKFKYSENIKPYPNIKRHLDKFQKVITSDNKPYGLHRTRDEHFFNGEKIIAVRKCIEPTFTYTDFDCYVSATFYIIKTEKVNLKYLTALLNSKLIAFWLKHKGKMQGNNYQIDKEPLLALPLKSIPDSDQKPFIDLVDKILVITKDEDYLENSSKQEKVKDYERQIDQMVYKLYKLTAEEIKIVEGEE